MLCYVMLCCVMLCYVRLCYVTLCYVTLCYVMLSYVMLCYVMLCYVMLCYVIGPHKKQQLKLFSPVINQLDAHNFCFTISIFHASTCFEHMCSKHVESWNKLIVKQKFCASSCLITEINILRCRLAKRQKLKLCMTNNKYVSFTVIKFLVFVMFWDKCFNFFKLSLGLL